MKHIFVIAILIFSICSSGLSQEEESLFTSPEDWKSERLHFPLSFAPSIDMVGYEDLKFAPKWSDSTSQEFWTYTFVWYNEKITNLSEDYLSENMEDYFDGLMGLDNESKNASNMPEGTKSIFMNTSEGFVGKIETYDAFFTRKELTLYVKAKEIFCTSSFRQFVFFKLSPKRWHEETWKIFDDVSLHVECD